MPLNNILTGLHKELCRPALVSIKQEKDDEKRDGDDKGGEGITTSVLLVINMAVKSEPLSDTLTLPKKEPDRDEEEKKFNKLEAKSEGSSDTTIIIGQPAGEDSGTECWFNDNPEDDETEVEDEETEVEDDFDDDSDSDDEVVPVKDTLKHEDTERMLNRCDRFLKRENNQYVHNRSKEWPVDHIKLVKKINKMNIFSDCRLNDRLKEVLLMNDSLRSIRRAVQLVAYIFWDRHNLRSNYLPEILTQLPEILSGKMPLRNYKLFFAVFMHLLSCRRAVKFEKSSYMDSIAAVVHGWKSWYSVVDSSEGKKKKSHSNRHKKSGNSDDEEEDDEFQPMKKRCRKRLKRQPSHVSLKGEFRWPRLYDLKGSIKHAQVFNDNKLNRLLIELMLTRKSLQSLSGAVDNLGRVFWSREEIRHHKFPSPEQLLNPILIRGTGLQHADKFYQIFMKIHGQCRSLYEFATSRWAQHVYSSFGKKFPVI